MIRSAKLPFLPGYDFSHEVGQTRFHKSTQFEYLGGLVPYLSEADRPGSGGYPLSWVTPDTTPSLYPRRECKELPGWLAFDNQILTFNAYFQEAMWEVDKCPFQIRKVKIYYYPEDGTIQVIEPKVDNSGMTQGISFSEIPLFNCQRSEGSKNFLITLMVPSTIIFALFKKYVPFYSGVLIGRQRIRFPKPMDNGFYDMIDFNIGKNVELYGKVFRIVDCDQFTRNFLNRMGIFVGDPLLVPEDPFRAQEEKKKLAVMGKKPRKTPPALGRYLEFDRKVLRFFGYWDDRPSQYGYIHKLEIHFFLSDDTIEIRELIPRNSGIDSGSMFLKRMKLPKNYDKLPGPGDQEPAPLLNVWPTGFLKGRYVVDPINAVGGSCANYKDNDLAIGVALNVFGRKVVLTDCDDFTKEYYRATYGIETFDKIQTPDDSDEVATKDKQLPPWNGYGSYEDSEGNCRKVVPAPPKKDMYKFLAKGRMGIDSHILKFKAKMISVDPVNDDRTFIISYYLTDDQISIYERAARNSGFTSRSFYSKREIFKPDQERFVSVKPETFHKKDLWIGNTIKLEGFKFKLISADEYCLRYMELHSQEFPKSNAKLILDKVREKVRPIYKDFVANFLRPCLETSYDQENCLSYCQLRNALVNLFGNDITEHEIITLARQFRVQEPHRRLTKPEVINACRTECRKKIWLGFDRLRENLDYKDPCCTGFVPVNTALSLCKGAKVPIIPDFLGTILELVDKNECGDVSIEDLIGFFDTRKGICKPTAPFNHSREFSELSKMKGSFDYSWVDCSCFLKGLGLEEELESEGQATRRKPVELTTNQATAGPY